MTMEPLDYEKLVNGLDAQIAEAKQATERKARKEALERTAKQVRQRATAIEGRLIELAKYGASNPEADRALAAIKAEAAQFDAEIAMLTDPQSVPTAEPGAPPMNGQEWAFDGVEGVGRPLVSEERREIEMIMADVAHGSVALPSLPPDQAWATAETWAVRWRIAVDHIGQDRAHADQEVRTCYGAIREAMRILPSEGSRFIKAIHRSQTDDWNRKLDRLSQEISDLGAVELRRQRTEARLDELKALPSRYSIPEDPEGVRMLKHYAREVARDPSMREDLAAACIPWKDVMGLEFEYLWRDDEAREVARESKRKMTNREIVARLLNRMIGRAYIGACHGPGDAMHHGFPDHEKHRSKEALQMLMRAGVVRVKPTQIGPRVSIEPARLGDVETFLKGGTMGAKAVDEFCAARV